MTTKMKKSNHRFIYEDEGKRKNQYSTEDHSATIRLKYSTFRRNTLINKRENNDNKTVIEISEDSVLVELETGES